MKDQKATASALSLAKAEPIIYRRALQEDTALVTDLRLEVLQMFQGTQTAAVLAATRPVLLEGIRKGLEEGSYVCWLALAGEEPVGSGGMSIRERPGNFRNPSGRTAYIMSMYTRPAFRGCGICTTLVGHLEETARAMGILHVELHATAAGEKVYRKLGYILHDEPTYLKLLGDH